MQHVPYLQSSYLDGRRRDKWNNWMQSGKVRNPEQVEVNSRCLENKEETQRIYSQTYFGPQFLFFPETSLR